MRLEVNRQLVKLDLFAETVEKPLKLTKRMLSGTLASQVLRAALCEGLFENVSEIPDDNGRFLFQVNGIYTAAFRILTKRGVDFRPSSQRGVGRYVDKDALPEYWAPLHGWIVADISKIASNGYVCWYFLLNDLDAIHEVEACSANEFNKLTVNR